MKPQYFLFVIALLLVVSCRNEPDPPPEPSVPSLYFPQNWTGNWETISTDVLDWNQAAIGDLYSFLDSTDTRGFIVLVNGRIALEHYNGNQLNGQPFDRNSNWYWASAGKTLAAFGAAIAMDEGMLDFEAPVSQYLGTGWSSLTAQQESNIVVRHILTMSSGLDDGVSNPNCTDPSCFEYLTDPETRWAYHNGAYTLSHDIIGSATSRTFDAFIIDSLTSKIGVAGNWFWLGGNHVYFSNTRSMARFGLLNLAEGVWNGEPLISKSTHQLLTTTSQTENLSYGYLYWLNGQTSYMLPGSQLSFNGNLIPSAPADMYAGIGKNGQLMMISPSLNMVVVRMGEDPSGYLVPVAYPEELWQKLNDVINR